MIDQLLKLLQGDQEKPDVAQQMLAARFQQEPTFNDVANSTFEGALNKKYIDPQAIADSRGNAIASQLAQIVKMNSEAQKLSIDNQRLNIQQQSADENSRHNRETEVRLAEVAANRAANSGGGAPPKPMNEYQGKSGLFASRMAEAEPVLTRLANTNTLGEKAKAAIPIAGNFLVSNDYQQLDQAKRNFINATLRQESGAAINQQEFVNAEKQYFPQPGDQPDVISQKAANRRTAINAMQQAAGPAYEAPVLSNANPSKPVTLSTDAPPAQFKILKVH